jgi:urease accessory protein
MMNRFSIALGLGHRPRRWRSALATGLGASLLLTATPALAHHAMGGGMPTTFFEGFVSGLAHPMIGFDHFAFIVSVGLLSAVKRQGITIPIAFAAAAMAGTGLHLTGLSLPGLELWVAASVVLFGLLLALKNNLNTAAIVGLGAIAGLCHGYAYGEAIFGAEMSPLVAYLSGFTVTQLVVMLSAFGIGKALLNRPETEAFGAFRSAGWTICGVGLAFLASQVMGMIVPSV